MSSVGEVFIRIDYRDFYTYGLYYAQAYSRKNMYQRHVLLALGSYQAATHRGIARLASERGWHLTADMAYGGIVPSSWVAAAAVEPARRRPTFPPPRGRYSAKPAREAPKGSSWFRRPRESGCDISTENPRESRPSRTRIAASCARRRD